MYVSNHRSSNHAMCSVILSLVSCDNNFIQQMKEIQQVKQRINSLKPSFTPTRGRSKFFVHPKWKDYAYVFLRLCKVHPSLYQPYYGSHEVLLRSDKRLTIIRIGKKSYVSLDCVKSALVFNRIE